MRTESQCPVPVDRILTTLGNGASLLDIGCGTGRVLAALMNHGYSGSLHGIDWSRPAIEIAQKRIRSAHLCTGDCRSMPYGDGTFDACVLSAVLTCFVQLDDVCRVLSETYRVLKPIGTVFLIDFLVTPDLRNIWRYVTGFIRYKRLGAFWSGYPFRHFTQISLMRLMRDAGFQITVVNAMTVRSWHGHKQRGIYLECVKPCGDVG